MTNLRQLLDQAPVGIAATDSGGMCTFVNERFGMLYGGPPETLLGRSWLSVVDPADRARVRRAWLRAVAGGRGLDTECWLCPAARPFVHVTAAPLEDGHFVVTLTEVTRYRAREERRARRLKAEAAAKQRSPRPAPGCSRWACSTRASSPRCPMSCAGR